MAFATRAAVRRGYSPNKDINVTPFVDIMLVLLIVFMVAAPLLTTAILVDNPPPKTAKAPVVLPLMVSLSSSGEIHMAKSESSERICAWQEVKTCLKSFTNGNVSERIIVRADQDVAYGEVVRLLDIIRDAGYTQMSIVGEEAEPAPVL